MHLPVTKLQVDETLMICMAELKGQCNMKHLYNTVQGGNWNFIIQQGAMQNKPYT